MTEVTGRFRRASRSHLNRPEPTQADSLRYVRIQRYEYLPVQTVESTVTRVSRQYWLTGGNRA